jgi:hypothetical protein
LRVTRVGGADRYDGLDGEAVLEAASRREQWAIADLSRARRRLMLSVRDALVVGVVVR